MNNDLISRETLQEKHSKECIHNCYYCKHYKWSSKHTHGYCDVIDNAPTVKPQKIVTIPPELIEKLASCVVNTIEKIDWDKAIEAYKERPQGEWIDCSEDYGYVECPFCEQLTTCEGNIDELHYCWNCGAKLGKGGAE